MTKNRNHAELVREFVSVFRCPVCNSAMNVVDWKSLLCANNHKKYDVKATKASITKVENEDRWPKAQTAARFESGGSGYHDFRCILSSGRNVRGNYSWLLSATKNLQALGQSML